MSADADDGGGAPPVILSRREQEYLLHAIETALPVRDARQLFLWSQGALQALLPHRVMVCLRLDAHGQARQLECLHGAPLDAAVRARLDDPLDGLAARLARHCGHGGRSGPGAVALPARLDAGPGADAACAGQSLAAFQGELRELGLDNMLLHGSGALPGGATFFALFGLPQRPHARHAHFLDLLLPQLDLALRRAGRDGARAPALARPVSAREAEVLHWVREGKSNDEIGQILGISGLTVKNHLQRLYRLLGVSNRAHAIARGMALQLFAPPPLARAA